jgi:hypothetical protein
MRTSRSDGSKSRLTNPGHAFARRTHSPGGYAGAAPASSPNIAGAAS